MSNYVHTRHIESNCKIIFAARILVSTAGNIACLIAAALLAYLPAEKTWMRLVAFWLVNVFGQSLVVTERSFPKVHKSSGMLAFSTATNILSAFLPVRQLFASPGMCIASVSSPRS